MLSAACTGNSATVSGRLAGPGSSTVLLQELGPEGNVCVDSTTTDRKGNFRFRVELPSHGPVFYTLQIGSAQIPLFVSSGERIHISSYYGNPDRYTVEGSHESELLNQMHATLERGMSRLDSLGRLIATTDEKARSRYLQEYSREYTRLKRAQIKFIVTNSGSLAALYALQQHLPDGRKLFNGQHDLLYYRLVADSVSKYYPESPYLASFRSYLDSADSNHELTAMIRASLCNPAPYPDLALPDMYGTTHRLSDLSGKVILLDFWSAGEKRSAIYNAELKEIYRDMADRGFEIYQVGMDMSRQTWVNAVLAQQLPWISVCDFKGRDGIAPRVYNITSIPSNYLIDRQGEIVARNVSSERLRDKVEELLDK